MNDQNNNNPTNENTPIPTPATSDAPKGFEPPSGDPVSSASAQTSASSSDAAASTQAQTAQIAQPLQTGNASPSSAGSTSTTQVGQASSTPTTSFGATSAPSPYSAAANSASAHPAPSVPPVTNGNASVAGANQVIYGKPKTATSKSGKTFLIAFAGALVACVVAFGAMFAFGAFGNNSGSSVTLGSSNGASIDASDVDATLAEAVASQCLPSVVSIDVLGTQSQGSGGSIYEYLYGFENNGNQSNELTEIGLGSGVIISDDGYIITNYHVIEGGQKFEVTVAGEQKEAELVGSDSSSDIAVLKITDGSGYTAIKLGDSANIKIGEWVMSIGSPFGLEQSVATGIISATSRSQVMDAETDMLGQSTGEVTIYPNMIQTDAAINPGNSGGALVNSQGELVGINTLITSYSGNYSGVGFAIPSNYAINIAQSIISGKEPTRAYMGISMTTINSSTAKMYGFSADAGAYISGVEDGSAAANAGLQVGDIITAFDGEKVSSASDVMLDVRTKNPGDKVTITYMRGSEEKTAEVTLGQTEESSKSSSSESSDQNGTQDKENSNGKNSGNGSNSRNPFGL